MRETKWRIRISAGKDSRVPSNGITIRSCLFFYLEHRPSFFSVIFA